MIFFFLSFVEFVVILEVLGMEKLDKTKVKSNLWQMIWNGDNGYKVICEAAFVYENNYCAVDILKVIDENTVEIYEVKSVTEVKKYHIIDTYSLLIITKLTDLTLYPKPFNT